MRGYSNPPAELGVRSLAIADGAFSGGQVAILQGLEHGRFRGWDAGKFKEFIRPVGKTIVWEPFVVIVAGMPQGRGINASPATDVTVRVYSIVEGQATLPRSAEHWDGAAVAAQSKAS